MNLRSKKTQPVRYAVVATIGAVCLLFASVAFTLEPLYDGFRSPVGIACDANGSIYVTNWGSNTIERITKNGGRTVFASGIVSPAGIAIDLPMFPYIQVVIVVNSVDPDVQVVA